MLTSNKNGDVAKPAGVKPVQFRRSLRIQDVILFGVICVTPTAPIPLFGIMQKLSQGHGATTVALAMLAMLPTAFSYGRMASRYPLAGSAYAYVAHGLHPNLGFLAGWATTLDYFLIPMTGVIYCAVTMHRVMSSIPYPLWAVVFAALATFLNLRGIRTGIRAQQAMLVVMIVVIVATVVLAFHYIWMRQGPSGLISTVPFYNPKLFDFRTIATATSFAALTYIGFDAVTTLAEEVENSSGVMVRATVWVCLITGSVSVLLVYLGQLVWPSYQSFSDFDTAFLDVSQRIGGSGLFTAMVVVLTLATFGAALTGQAGAARVLLGMGRTGAIPQFPFAHLNARTLQPSYNVCLVGLLVLVGALAMNFEQAGELLNFGAFLAFMGVNLAAMRVDLRDWRAQPTSWQWLPALIALVGLLSCLGIWLSLPGSARRVGFIWMAVGIIYQLVRTRGFRTRLGFALDERS